MLRINFGSQGQTIMQQRGNLLFVKWHDKRDVAFLSRNVSPEEPSWTVQCKKNGRNIDIQKPCVLNVYTANMGGVDRAEISANSVVLHYAKCSASSSIKVKTLEH